MDKLGTAFRTRKNFPPDQKSTTWTPGDLGRSETLSTGTRREAIAISIISMDYRSSLMSDSHPFATFAL
jgi:hypothetical protein